MGADEVEHHSGILVLEHVPTEVALRNFGIRFGVEPMAFLENGVFERYTQEVGSGFLLALGIVQHLHEEEVGHLFEHRNGISNTACPEGIPNIVYLGFDFSGYHPLVFFYTWLYKECVVACSLSYLNVGLWTA